MTEDPRIDPADLRNVRFPGSSRRYEARAVDQFLETVAARIDATNDSSTASRPASPRSTPPVRRRSRLRHRPSSPTSTTTSWWAWSARRRRRCSPRPASRRGHPVQGRGRRRPDDPGGHDRGRSCDRRGQGDRRRPQPPGRGGAGAGHGEATAEASRIRDEAVEAAEATTSEAAERAEARARRRPRSAAPRPTPRSSGSWRRPGRRAGAWSLEAKEVRSRVLEDLQRRRDLARDQIERLLAGRERLLAAYGLVRENLDDITEQLADSLPDPGEPDLPDGFVGIVGSSAIAADDELHEARRRRVRWRGTGRARRRGRAERAGRHRGPRAGTGPRDRSRRHPRHGRCRWRGGGGRGQPRRRPGRPGSLGSGPG